MSYVEKEETIEALADIEPPEVIEQIFNKYFRPKEQEGGKENAYEAINEKISKFFGDFLLQTGNAFDLSEFEPMWQQTVPEGIKTELEHLKDLAFIDKSKKPFVIKV